MATARAFSLRAQSIAVLLLVSCSAYVYHTPDAEPREFKEQDLLPVEVGSLSSFDTPIRHDYYSLPFCTPEGGVQRSTSSANTGSSQSGLETSKSPYVFKMKVARFTEIVCANGSAGALTAQQVENFKAKIDNRYRVRMVLDNLPITTYDLEKGPTKVQPGSELGFELGYTDGENYYVFNHLVFNVLIHKMHGEVTSASKASYEDEDLAARRLLTWPEGTPEPVIDALKAKSARTQAADTGVAAAPEMWKVVGFEVMPCSIKREAGDKVDRVRCMPLGARDNPTPQPIREGADIIYTYDVYFKPSDIEWASRWDAYLRLSKRRSHWFSSLNPLQMALVLVAVVMTAFYMHKARRALAKYQQVLLASGSRDGEDDSGGKQGNKTVVRSKRETFT